MKHADHDHPEQRERRRARDRRPLQNNAGSDRRWIEGKDVHLADEIREYSSSEPPKRDTRIVTFGLVLLFSAESGDAWMLDSGGQTDDAARGGWQSATRPRRGD